MTVQNYSSCSLSCACYRCFCCCYCCCCCCCLLSGSDIKNKKPDESHLKSGSAAEDRRDGNDSRGEKRTSGHLSGLHHHGDKYHHGSGRDKDSKRVCRSEPKEAKKSVQPAEREEYWLSSNLRVKVVDRAYKNGRHYNTKVRAM